MSPSLNPRGPFHDHGEAPSDPEPRAEQPGNGQEPWGDAEPDPVPSTPAAVPGSPRELIAMQRNAQSPQEPSPSRVPVEELLARIGAHGCTPWEAQQLCLALVAQLEEYHHQVLTAMEGEDQKATPAQVACWAIDGDRLMHCRRLLESLTLI